MLATIPLSKGPIEYELGILTLHPYPTLVMIVFPLALWRVLRRPAGYGIRGIEIVLILLTLSFLQSTLLSDTLIISGRLAFHALFIPVLSYFIAKALIKTDSEYIITINILVLSILVMSIVALAKYIETGIRPIVFSIEPIGVASITIVGLYASIFNSNDWKIIKHIKTLIIGFAFVFSMSRVYLMYAIVSPLIILVIKKNIILLWILMFTGSLVATLVFTYTIVDYAMVHTSAEGANTLERMYEVKHFLRALIGRAYVYKSALDEFWSNVVFGAGIHAGEMQITTHNFHVEWLQYGGVLGYILYTSVFMLHVKNASTYVKQDGYLLANEVVLLGIMINSITNGFMHGVIPYMAFLIMGISEARISILKKSGAKYNV
ncbi:MAG: hypothetical protein ABW084_01425 [Candidatus Thiodiazotropha sp.]